MKWKPRYNEKYYIPTIDERRLYLVLVWKEDKTDLLHFRRNLVCKTKAEVIKKAKLILRALKREGKK